MQNNLEALFFFSQCDHTCAVEDETLHLLSHTIRHSSKTMHENLVKSLKADVRRKWVHNIGWEMLCKKGILVDDYLHSLVQPGFKLDELALVIYARMYHIRIGVILKTDFWTTRTNEALEDCDAILCFHGNLKFFDTRQKISEVVDLTGDGENEDSIEPSQPNDTKWKTFNSLKTDLKTEVEITVLYEQMHGKKQGKVLTSPRPKKLVPEMAKRTPPEKNDPPKDPNKTKRTTCGEKHCKEKTCKKRTIIHLSKRVQ